MPAFGEEMKIAIIGSTGSIGRNALKVLENLPGKNSVYALSGKKNVMLLSRQIQTCAPRAVCVHDKESSIQLKRLLKNRYPNLKIFQGTEGLRRIAALPAVDMVLIALVGSAGVHPLLSAIRSKKKIALANKESLVMAGDLIMREAQARNVSIIPVDSEHSAIFQCLKNADYKEIKRLILTASGGPFYNRKNVSFKKVSVNDALDHPNWKMGKKITIDSATLMNKGLEAIEAHHLFNVPMDKIQVLIHPQSIVHSLVEFVDGSVLAQMSNPDMRLPIQYALTHPAREKGVIAGLKLEDIQKLEFYKPDFSRFPCLPLALKAGRIGGTMPVVLNGANEVAVEAFLQGKISFDKIAMLVKTMMDSHQPRKNPDLDEILSVDAWTRAETQKLVNLQGRDKSRPTKDFLTTCFT